MVVKYDPTKSDFKTAFAEAYPDFECIKDGIPIAMIIKAYYRPPDEWSATRKYGACKGLIYPTDRNLQQITFHLQADMLNLVFRKKDQIFLMSSELRYATYNKIVVRIFPVFDAQDDGTYIPLK